MYYRPTYFILTSQIAFIESWLSNLDVDYQERAPSWQCCSAADTKVHPIHPVYRGQSLHQHPSSTHIDHSWVTSNCLRCRRLPATVRSSTTRPSSTVLGLMQSRKPRTKSQIRPMDPPSRRLSMAMPLIWRKRSKSLTTRFMDLGETPLQRFDNHFKKYFLRYITFTMKEVKKEVNKEEAKPWLE